MLHTRRHNICGHIHGYFVDWPHTQNPPHTRTRSALPVRLEGELFVIELSFVYFYDHIKSWFSQIDGLAVSARICCARTTRFPLCICLESAPPRLGHPRQWAPSSSCCSVSSSRIAAAWTPSQWVTMWGLIKSRFENKTVYQSGLKPHSREPDSFAMLSCVGYRDYARTETSLACIHGAEELTNLYNRK